MRRHLRIVHPIPQSFPSEGKSIDPFRNDVDHEDAENTNPEPPPTPPMDIGHSNQTPFMKTPTLHALLQSRQSDTIHEAVLDAVCTKSLFTYECTCGGTWWT
jgi:hypothetical protein